MKFVTQSAPPKELLVTAIEEDGDVNIHINGVAVVWFSSLDGCLWRFNVTKDNRQELARAGVAFKDDLIAIAR